MARGQGDPQGGISLHLILPSQGAALLMGRQLGSLVGVLEEAVPHAVEVTKRF